MKTGHLNLTELLKDAEDDNKWYMPADTVIGHIHLQVSDLDISRDFYSETLGLHHTCTYPGANFFAAGDYHHHIATNIWLGNNISSANQNEVGLDYFSLNLNSEDNFEELLQQLMRMKIETSMDESNRVGKKSFFISDPDGIKIHIYCR